MPRPKSELTKFILSLPTNLSAAEVMEKAKAAGMQTTESNVHRVRRASQGPEAAKAPAAKKAAPAKEKPAAAPKAAAAAAPADAGGINKAAFVRSLPATMRAKEVAEKAKDAGISISEKYVYTIRSNVKSAKGAPVAAKKKAGRPAGSKTAARPAAEPAAAPAAAPASGGEIQFRTYALEIGVGRARKILDDMERKLHALIRG